MKAKIFIVIITLLMAMNASAQVDSIHFSVRVGVWYNLPDSVRDYTIEKEGFIDTQETNRGALSKVYIGKYACEKEAREMLMLVKNDGYQSAWVNAWCGEKRITVKEAADEANCPE